MPETPVEPPQKPSQINDGGAGDDIHIPDSAFLILEGTKAVPLDRAIIKIGRSHDNSIVLDDPRVSRHHVEIRVIREHFVLFDLGSSGGTYINGQRISQGLLYPGDMISLAGINIVFIQGTRLPGQSEAERAGTLPGSGQRPTAVLNTSTFSKKKRRPW
jgi:pSer/pThr/pTyr-binding forkhead associated (FHA) protein